MSIAPILTQCSLMADLILNRIATEVMFIGIDEPDIRGYIADLRKK